MIKRKFSFASKTVYDNFRRYFPFSCIDLLIFKNNQILLTKRTLPPYKGFWQLPGGIIRKQENMKNAVKRLAKEELGVKIDIEKYIGVYESLNQYRHDLSHGFIVSVKNGRIKTDYQAEDLGFFKKIPNKTVFHHKTMIKDAKKLLRNPL